MLEFCGQDYCSIDANGRLKLSPRLIDNFLNRCNGEVVLHCLPEGAIALYPEEVFQQIRKDEMSSLNQVGSSALFRRSLRRFGALSLPDTISKQGRLTIPPPFREYAELGPGTEAVVVGIEIGAEIWNLNRWKTEMELLNSHLAAKAEEEMAMDLERR